MPLLPNRMKSRRLHEWWQNFRQQAYQFIYR